MKSTLRAAITGYGVVLLLGAVGQVWAQTPATAAQPPAGSQHTTGVGAEVLGKDLTAQERAAQFAKWRAEIRRTLYVPDAPPKLEAKTWSTFSPTPGVLADRVTYHTLEGMIVPAIVYRPDPKVLHWKGKLPGIVVVNGHGGDKFSWYAYYSGMMFAKAGAVVVTYDPIGEGERNIDKRSQGRSHDAWIAPAGTKLGEGWGLRLAGLMQVDLMQGVSYLAERPEVDAKRIAVLSFSMGAFVGGITGAIDPAIHAVLLSGGGVFDREEPGYFGVSPKPCQGPPMRALHVLGDPAVVLYALNADRGPMYVMNGAADQMVAKNPPAWFDAVRKQAVELRGTDENMFTTVLYPGIGHRPSWVNRDGVEWLDEQIHFAIWTPAEIATDPVTHISEWAKMHGVTGPMAEDAEGGLEAVGVGLPALRREDLMVLPEGDWVKLNGRLTYGGWVSVVKEEMSRPGS
jgi:dienelactone hydrolase